MKNGSPPLVIRVMKLAVIQSFLLVCTLPSFAQLPTLIPREVLFGNPEKLSPQISPDGKLLAYVAPTQGVLNVWIRTLGQNDDHVITADKKRGIRSYLWQPNAEGILYIQDRDGDENWHIYQTNLVTQNTRDLTPFQGVQASIVSTSRRFPEQLLVALNLKDRKVFDVYRINLTDGCVELDTQNPGDVAGWVADGDLRVRAVRATPSDGSTEIRIRDDVRSPWRTIRKFSGDETGDIVGFTPNDKGVWLTSTENANAKRLLEVDLVAGTTTVLAEDKQYDVASTLRSPQTRALEAVRFDSARSEWLIIDKSLQPDFDILRKVREGDLYIFSRDRENKTWIVYYLTDDGPIYYYTYDRNTRIATLLFTGQPALEKYKLSRMRPISFQARDGMTIYGYLTLPVGIDAKRLPLVLFVHGGPWTRDTWGFCSFCQMLANRGYAVLQVNFRGSTGYGKTYLNAGNHEWAGKMQTDLLDGKNWAVKQGYVDARKVCIAGPSYGGYATLVGLTFTPDEFVCGIDLWGPSNLITLIKSLPPYWIAIRATFDKRVGNSDEELRSRSPLFKADRIKAPLLIMQGAKDPRVPPAESEQIVAAIRKNRGEVEYLLFPDEGHGFVRTENVRKEIAIIDQFLGKYLGGRYEPLSDKETVDDLRK